MLRYYPSFRVIKNLTAGKNEFLDENGKIYSGKYYLAYNGKAFTGPNPQQGPGNPLTKISSNYSRLPGINSVFQGDFKQKSNFIQKTNSNISRVLGKPISYYPFVLEQDYKKGYVIRYFTKKENENGFIIEISEEEYNSIVNGTANYDIRLYQVTKILWKLTGPLNNTRKSQYNIIPGIIDTNKRLVETANKTFLGIVEFIDGEYSKFARPTM